MTRRGGKVDSAPRELIDHLFAISRVMAGKLDFRSAIQAVATEVAQIVPHDHLDVCIVRGDGRFHTAYESGIQTEWSKSLDPVEQSPIRNLLEGEVDHILSYDACNDARFCAEKPGHRPIFDHGLRSRIHVPMVVHGEVIGALSCSLCSQGAYGPIDVRNARYIADLLSPYFFALRAAEQARLASVVEAEAKAREEGLRLGALKLTEALEGERQRIGMDLHDQTLADLTRLVRRLERLALSGPVSADALKPVVRGFHACMEDLRQIIEEAQPSVLQLFGFAHAVENQLERSIRDSGQAIDWQISGDSRAAFDGLDPKVSIALFRIVQEAINNAVQHAEPKRIVVRLDKGRDHVGIAVIDDGKGTSDRRIRRGSGIENMKTRARLISARFALQDDPGGRGTKVTIVLPVRGGTETASDGKAAAE
ncbi:GAF domain-containing sensor histidine kinase [Tabrizicola sp. J26]|uniref:GAF domain-containing sensor histidine kinase n=1 Tax=Alitabrizicola rongguiensis TaxID=2909234 RepID=UPI001F3CB261|nr:GAF domain-containing sensor histidine kinase [Tabrizicola rongguiensis]MCF1709415.1 GAF domain-containing sensor histidine kinase [Tabrizicola rongguiensis]